MARHNSLAEQLAPLLRYATTPDHEPEPVQTNWSVVAANDNNAEDLADFGHERFLRISPSLDEIMRSVTQHEPERNVTGQVVKWGTLRFSDGTQIERCTMYGIDGKIITGDITMPTGSILRARDELEANLGGSGKSKSYHDLSNRWFAETLGVDLPHRFIPAAKMRKGRNYSRDEAVTLLAEAKANTPVMPTVTVLPAGLPCGMKLVADAFLGMKKGKKGESGSMSWQDFATLKSGREAWRDALRSLEPQDKAVLEKASVARSMADLVEDAPERTAFRKGKAALIAANDNLMRAIENYAA